MDRTQRVRLRFEDMLMSAELAAEQAAQERPGIRQPSTLMLATTKAVNRAGGFLDAVSIVLPHLRPELLDAFETLMSRVDSLSLATRANGERRSARATDDRRARDRRKGYDRRHHSMALAVERRLIPIRRAAPDRRTAKIRELADRRLRAVLRRN
ncbi:MAG TPA: hypothetical protein VIP78_16045 [Candidatus Dormibacteraeota bacterium]